MCRKKKLQFNFNRFKNKCLRRHVKLPNAYTHTHTHTHNNTLKHTHTRKLMKGVEWVTV